ncbi:elongation factor TS-domain-containing protein [Cokeromyces recurvatus]|uniref:elongation factor TS-domain-containing protein n=1 Tax=Cokeromyces recurvatus TaxID=90255 RepID=UPI0022210E02|nr:elongation factor TS-domain-containing protein [Cokeromyces recurvatus]KAI7906414.1 elongation factor TS-domain-containing protein [Cokeromyces recurvatus]
MNRLNVIRTVPQVLLRRYTTAIKPDIKLLKELRKETEVSMSKAKEALIKTNNDYAKALVWLSEDAQISGAKKAQKVSGRTAGEGLITTASVEVPVSNGFKSKSTIIELNCETDFVSRNDVFKNLASRIAATSLLMHESSLSNKACSIENIPIDDLLNAPLMPHPSETELNSAHIGKTIKESIVETIGKLGENITLRRAAVVSEGVSASYIHGGDANSGKIGGIAVLQPKKVTNLTELNEANIDTLLKTARQVARQVVGFNPTYLNSKDIPDSVLQAQTNLEEFEETHVLNKQKYLLNPELTISEYVNQAADGAEVIDFIRWEVGEGIEKKENNFADEVLNAARGN